MTTTVREFNTAGPCIVLGELVSQTERMVTFRDRDGRIRRRGGHPLKCGLVHTVPCPSCRDHANSQYPNGFED